MRESSPAATMLASTSTPSTFARRLADPGRWVVGDVTDETIFPDEQFDCVLANSLMHHLDDRAVRNLLGRMARLTAPGGKVHVLDLVRPAHASAGRLLARLDRGQFARPIESWRTCSPSICATSTSSLTRSGCRGFRSGRWCTSWECRSDSRRVTIAIPIHNEEEVLPELLRRVFAVLDHTPGGPHELLLVDDGSRDGSLRIMEDAVHAIHDCASSCCRAISDTRPPSRRPSITRPAT